ncbi:MAG: RHS repeat-associated core domain-containing protein [Sandaracinaceae bacterium]
MHAPPTLRASAFAILVLAACAGTDTTDDASAPDADAGAPDGAVPGPEGNSAPAFITTPPTTVAEGDTYLYGALAEDPDFEILTYAKIEGPEGLEVARDTGAVYWAVGQRAAGHYDLVIEASDPHGARVQQRASIEVTRVNVPPIIESVPPRGAPLGTELVYDAVAIDDDGDELRWSLSERPEGMTVDPAGHVRFRAAARGVYRAILEVRDPDGASASQRFSVAVGTGSDGVGPAVHLDRPIDGAVIEEAAEVTGSVSAPELAGWRVEVCQPADRIDSCDVIATGIDPVDAGLLASLDPRGLLDEAARVRLVAWDAELDESVAERTVSVASRNHPGMYGLEMVDLVTRVEGQRLELRRVYDSRREHEEELGVGWSLETDLEAAANAEPSFTPGAPLHSDWMVSGGVFGRYIDETSSHALTLTVPDASGDRVYVIDFAPYFESPIDNNSVVPDWAAPPGVSVETIHPDGRPYGTQYLSAVNIGPDDTRLWLFPDAVPYDPPAYRITTELGERFEVARDGTILSGAGGSGGPGPGVRLTRDGVFVDGDPRVTFRRDDGDRIVEIRDVLYMRSVSYRYDAEGRLLEVTYPEAQVASFTWVGRRLTEWTLPDGLGLTRVDFDREGRVIRRVFPEGRILVYRYDDAASTMTVLDATGATVTYHYDARGDVDWMRDPMGGMTTMTHDAEGRLRERTDPTGRTSTYDYDGVGNLIRSRDRGREWSAAYSMDGLPVRVTDTNGREFRVENDGEGLPRAIVGPGGQTIQAVTYDADGRVDSITRGLGDTTRYHYDDEGRIDREEAEGGHTLSATRSADGLRGEVTDEDGTSTWWVEDVEGHVVEVGRGDDAAQYDYRFDGELAGFHAPGSMLEIERNPSGDVTRVVRDGETVEQRQYDSGGRLILLRGADGSYRRVRYDLNGNVAREETPEGVTEIAYDPGGEVRERTDTEGHAMAYERDEEGRVLAAVDPWGRRTTYGYDEQGRVIRTVAPDQGETIAEYDPETGLPSRVVTPRGERRLRYDPRFTHVDIDEEEVPITYVRDETGEEWTYDHDAQGRLIHVADPGGGGTTFVYEAGNVAGILDAANAEWRYGWEGDALLELVTPEGRRTSFDPIDGTIVRPDDTTVVSAPVGDEVVRTYGGALELATSVDATGRPVRTRSPAGTATYGWGPDGNLRSVIREDGARGALVRDAQGRVTEVLAVVQGQTLRTTYTWDALDRITELVDPSGGHTTYEYDDADRPTIIHRPNGIVSRYAYRPTGQPTLIEHLRSDGTRLDRVEYEYDGASRIVRASGLDGGWAYAYDPMGHVVRVDELDASGAVIATTRHEYDLVGNRIRTIDASGTTTRTFDRDGRLLGESTPTGMRTFTYDGRGNLTGSTGPEGTARYTWDEADRLVRIENPSGERFDNVYDGDGLLLESRGPDGVRRCLAAPRGLTSLSQCLAVYGDGAPRALVYGPEGLSADASATDARAILGGVHGTVRGVAGPDGAMLGSARYDAHGVSRSDDLPADLLQRFDGEVTRGGLVYLRSRWYSPALGMFLSPDTAPADPRDPRSLHRYLFALGDPVNRVDPQGTFSIAGIQVSMSIQGNLRSMNQAGTQAARCFTTRRIASLVGRWVVNMLLGAMLQRVQSAVFGFIPIDAAEAAADRLLRRHVFCNGYAGPRQWVTNNAWDVKFQVDVNTCGQAPRRNVFSGGVFAEVTTGWATCRSRGKPPIPGLVGFNASGIDFVLGSDSTANNGIPIELKRDQATLKPDQHRRYCRYASLSQYHMMFYIFTREIPSELRYATYAFDCMFPWRNGAGRLSTCNTVPRHAAGALLIWMGRQTTPRRRFRVYYPQVRGLCP